MNPRHSGAMIDADPGEAPALVLGHGITALGVLRVLARKGVPVAVLPPAPGPLVETSRWYRPSPMNSPWDRELDLASNLRQVDMDQAVLMPCTDVMTVATAGLPDDLRARFPSCLPRVDAIKRLVDKGAFVSLLRATNVPHPKTYLVDDSRGLDDIPPVRGHRHLFIKPRDSQSFFESVGRKAIRAGNRRELEAGVRRLAAAGHRLIIQEYVPGPASSHYFVDGFVADSGQIVAHLVRRRLRMYPPDFGNSSLVVTVPREEASEAVEALGRLFRALDYRGIFSAEFKRDADDGVFRILEVNARPWWYIEFAARAGLDVATMAYEVALGRKPPPASDYEVGRKLVYPYYDLHACLEMYDGRLKALWRFGRDAFGADAAIFAWDDPAPALSRWWRMSARGLIRRLPGRRSAAG